MWRNIGLGLVVVALSWAGAAVVSGIIAETRNSEVADCLAEVSQEKLPELRDLFEEQADLELPVTPDLLYGTEQEFSRYQREYDRYVSEFDSLNRQIIDQQLDLAEELGECS